ncbi:MAG TPA: hypothetical protein VD741_04530 [Solirubrobacterales bacterium]|nr:hypothetical protein [Solirubrobacterales bacterium]
MRDDVAKLLPSPEEIRCKLCVDLALQVRGVLEDWELAGKVDERTVISQVKDQRDQQLLGRLRQLLPWEDLTSELGEGVIDLDDLSRQLPFVYVMWVMISATDLAQLVEAIKGEMEQQQQD